MGQTTRHAGLDRLDLLAGDWDLQAQINGEQVAQGSTRFAWMEGEPFLIQRTGDPSNAASSKTEWAENAPDSVTMIIGLDDSNERYSALYADARGVYRVYQMTLDSETWTLHREAPGFSQRFTGEISADGRSIVGKWEKSTDGDNWEFDFDLIYTKTQ